jgi:hypothetical protein
MDHRLGLNSTPLSISPGRWADGNEAHTILYGMADADAAIRLREAAGGAQPLAKEKGSDQAARHAAYERALDYSKVIARFHDAIDRVGGANTCVAALLAQLEQAKSAAQKSGKPILCGCSAISPTNSAVPTAVSSVRPLLTKRLQNASERSLHCGRSPGAKVTIDLATAAS